MKPQLIVQTHQRDQEYLRFYFNRFFDRIRFLPVGIIKFTM